MVVVVVVVYLDSGHHEEYLVVFVVVQNLVGIDAADNMKLSIFCTFGVTTPVRPRKVDVWGDFTPKCGAI